MTESKEKKSENENRNRHHVNIFVSQRPYKNSVTIQITFHTRQISGHFFFFSHCFSILI